MNSIIWKIGGQMKILYYHDGNQIVLNRAVLEALSHYPVIPICNQNELEEQYIMDDFPILIVLSQPDMSFVEAIKVRKWSTLIKYVGVRDSFEDVGNQFSFENTIEAGEIIKHAIERQRHLRLNRYNAYMNHFDTDAFSLKQESKAVSASMWSRLSKAVNWSGIITMIGDPKAVSQFSTLLSSRIDGKLLIVDANLLKPSLDESFNIQRLQTKIKSHMVGIDNTGFNIALDAIQKKLPFSAVVKDIVHRKTDKLDVMLGNYNFHNYEHYDNEAIHQLIKQLASHYQILILYVNENPYDCMTLLSLEVSKVNVIIKSSQMSEMRYLYHMTQAMEVRRGLSIEKNLVIGYDGEKTNERLSRTAQKMLFGSQFLCIWKGHGHNVINKFLERIK